MRFTWAFFLVYKMVKTVQISKFPSLVHLEMWDEPSVNCASGRYKDSISEKGNWTTKDSLERSKKERFKQSKQQLGDSSMTCVTFEGWENWHIFSHILDQMQN